MDEYTLDDTLVSFLLRLAVNKDGLLDRFKADAKKVMAEEGLSAEAQAAVEARDKEALQVALGYLQSGLR